MRKKIFAPTIYPLNRDLAKPWFVAYRDATGKKFKRYGRLAHCTTLAERLKESNRLIKEILSPEILNVKQRGGLISNLQKVLDEKSHSLAIKTYQTYFYYLKKFSTWYNLEYKKDRKVNPYYYIIYLQKEKYSSNLVRKMACILGSFFNVLVKRSQYHCNPFNDVKIKKIKGKSKLPFHDIQIKHLLETIQQTDPQLRDAIDFLYYLYFRPAEIRQLKIEHILFHQMQVMATDEIIKDNDNYLKTIPLPMQQHILKYINYPPDYYIFSKGGIPGEKMLGKNELTTRMSKVLRGLNYGSRFSLYSWVHTGIKKAAMSGIPIKQLQLQKGHSDLKMFDEYLKDLGVNDCSFLVANFPAL